MIESATVQLQNMMIASQPHEPAMCRSVVKS